MTDIGEEFKLDTKAAGTHWWTAGHLWMHDSFNLEATQGSTPDKQGHRDDATVQWASDCTTYIKWQILTELNEQVGKVVHKRSIECFYDMPINTTSVDQVHCSMATVTACQTLSAGWHSVRHIRCHHPINMISAKWQRLHYDDRRSHQISTRRTTVQTRGRALLQQDSFGRQICRDAVTSPLGPVLLADSNHSACDKKSSTMWKSPS